MKNNIIKSCSSMLKTCFPIMYRSSPFSFFMGNSFFVIGGLLTAALVGANQILFDQATLVFEQSQGGAQLVFCIFAVCAIHIGAEIFNAIANFIGEALDEKAWGIFAEHLNQKVSRIHYGEFEKPEFLDAIERAYYGIYYAIAIMDTLTDIVLYYLPYILLLSIYLWMQSPMLVLLLFAVFIPLLATQFLKIKYFRDAEGEAAPLRRQAEHFSECIVGSKFYKETRILCLQSYFLELFKGKVRCLNKISWNFTKKNLCLETYCKCLTLIGYLGILVLLSYDCFIGKITIGAFAAIFYTIDNLFAMIETLICNRVASIMENVAGVENLLYLLEYSESPIFVHGTVESQNLKQSLSDVTLEHVSYSYPTSEKTVLSDICLNIKKNEKIAIVGENGSGKTTLSKLILGLYSPTKGRISYSVSHDDGITYKTLYNACSAVFQEFQRYEMTLEENLRLGSQICTKEQLKEVCIAAGVNVGETALAMGTVLSPRFGGIDLSGGQWQRIAIARAYLRKSEMIVLDEPTAAIDPLEENHMYKQFRKIIADKTAIIITHRLATVKFVDRIIVMQSGKTIASGTHEQLYKECDYYRDLWQTQEQYYVQ